MWVFRRDFGISPLKLNRKYFLLNTRQLREELVTAPRANLKTRSRKHLSREGEFKLLGRVE